MLKSYLVHVMVLLLTLILTATSFGYYSENDQGDRAKYEPTSIIVRFTDDVDISIKSGRGGDNLTGIASFDFENRKLGISKLESLLPVESKNSLPKSLKNMVVVNIPVSLDLEQVIKAYEDIPEIAYAHPDYQLQLYDSPDDPLYIEQWPLNNEGQGCRSVMRRPGDGNDTLGIIYGSPDADIDYHEVYNNPPDQTVSVILAVIDTGVDMDHPDLINNIWTNAREIPDNGIDDDHNGYIDDMHGYDFCSSGSSIPPGEDNDPTDPHGHGTHCSGVAAALTGNALGISGININCRIMALKFYPIMLTSLAVKAIVYAADNGADVITMSWGMPWAVGSLEDALNYARSKGVVLCAASGNDGYEQYNYPASFSGIITVGATQWEDKVTTFSTYGNHLNISAPGQSILSLRADNTDMYAGDGEPNVHIIDNNYYLASGTSMACPHVAAVAAFMRSVSPGLTPDATEEILEQSADDLIDPFGVGQNMPGWDMFSGYGRLNLNNALNSLPKIRALINSPLPNAIVTGNVPVEGIADGDGFTNYIIEYGEGKVPTSWTEILSSTTPVTENLLFDWNTSGLNGTFTLRLKVGPDNISMVTFTIANISDAIIMDPLSADTIMSVWDIIGTAICPDFSSYSLEYSSISYPDSWTQIISSSVPIDSGRLARWDTNLMDGGHYNLRLQVYSTSGLEVSNSIVVFVQSLFSSGDNWKIDYSPDVTPYPNYCDVDDDGAYEIIFGTSSGLLFLNPDGTEKTTGVPSLPAGNYRIPAAVGDLDGDGNDDFIVCSNSKIYGFPSTESSFEITLTVSPEIIGLDNGDEHYYPFVALKDIDSDGMDEILYFAGRPGSSARYFVYESDGSFLVEMPSGYYCYLAADLNGDGYDEFYMALNELIQCDQSGTIIDSYDLADGVASMVWAYYLSAADIDNDEKHELIVTTVDDQLGTGNFWLYAFDENLGIKESWPRNSGVSSYTVAPGPIFVDMDRDGLPEYFMTLYEFSSGMAYGWRLDGTPYLGDSLNPLFSSTPNPSRLYHPVFADMNGDNYPDLVGSAGANVLCETETNRLVAWDKDGLMLDLWPITVAADNCGHTRRFVPTIGDINGDGSVDLMMTTIANELLFLNFENNAFSEEASPAPFWRYNRRVNSCGPLYVFTETCGDVNSDGAINIFDITFLIDYLYRDGEPPPNPDMADVNSDFLINIFDITYLIKYLYGGGAAPDCP